ncbi:hypothetical protein Brsp05_03515 [Brucella sp. NBRC 12953]
MLRWISTQAARATVSKTALHSKPFFFVLRGYGDVFEVIHR